MLLKEENVLMYDIELLFEKARKSSFLGMKKKDVDESIRVIRPLKMMPENSELEFLDMRLIDNAIKKLIREMVDYLKKKKVIKAQEDIIRPLDGYFVFDENLFMGADMIRPALFFGEDAVLYPKGKIRKAQALVKYPEEIATYIKQGKMFAYLDTVEEGEPFTPSFEERTHFDTFVSITNSKNKKKSYFGVWE